MQKWELWKCLHSAASSYSRHCTCVGAEQTPASFFSFLCQTSLKHLLPAWETRSCRHSFCYPDYTGRQHSAKAEVLCCQEVPCAINSRGSEEPLRIWIPDTLPSSVLATHTSCWENSLFFPLLPSFFFPGSSSWLRSGAVPNCCDLMGGNLLDSCMNLLGEVNLIKKITLTSSCRLQQMPKKGAGLLSLSMTSVLWGSQLANEKKPDCKALPFPSLITYSRHSMVIRFCLSRPWPSRGWKMWGTHGSRRV